MLEPLGLSEIEEKVYVALLEHPLLSVTEISARTGVPRTKTRHAVASLESKMLASPTGGRIPRFSPTPPDVALDGLLYAQRRLLEGAHADAMDTLVKLYRPARRPEEDVVELVEGEEAVHRRSWSLYLNAATEILVFSKPPLVNPHGSAHAAAKLAEGMTYRVIYDHAALAVEGHLDEIRQEVAAGEVARAVPELPLKLSIIDRRVALLGIQTDGATLEDALVVRQSSILDAFLVMFEMMWERAIPLDLVDDTEDDWDQVSELTPEEHNLFVLLASGLKDEAIARQLGTTPRSLRRRTGPLLDQLGARTRFHAGVLAMRRGWISTD